MPLYHLSILRDGGAVREEPLRATNDEQALAKAQLRLARCGSGESLVLSLQGVERRRLGPKRSR